MPDVAVVGLGPAGIVAARVLHRAGIAVTAFQPGACGATGRAPLASPPPTLRAHPTHEAVAQPSPPAGRDGVGGAKLLAAPQAYRLDPWALGMRTHMPPGPRRLPDGVTLVDWPLGRDELDPWYERVEQATGVAPRPPTAWTERMRVAAESLYWHPFAAPAAESPDPSTLLPGTGVRIIAATVTRLDRDARGHVTGVEYIDEAGRTGIRHFDAVVVAASVIPTVRLLLLSDLHAEGRVGRWFLSHNTFVVHGHFAGVDLGRRHAGPASAVATSAFEGGADCAPAGVIGGSLLQAAMTGEWNDERMRATAATVGPSTTSDEDPLTWVRREHRSIGSVWGQPDQLPHEGNRIDLDPVHRDAAGIPVARVTFALADDDRTRWAHLSARAAEWLRAAGARATWAPPLQPQPLGTHLYGGARMGADPQTSVVDSYGRFHDVDGLVVLGSSTFPSTGGRGPVETIEALAWRAAVRLASDLR